MGNLAEYVIENCIRGTCTCGCTDVPAIQLDWHTVDVQFFKVSDSNLTDTDKEVMKNNFIQLVKNHQGIYGEIDLFDGNEHNFIEIGRWIGSQGIALELMGMGELPPNRLAHDFSEETRNMLAGAGYISIKYNSKKDE